MTFRSWLHSEPVRRRILPVIAGGARQLPQFLGQAEAYVVGDDALHSAVLLADPTSVVHALGRMANWELVPGDGCFLIPQRPDALGVQRVIAYQGYRGKAALLESPPSRGQRQLADKVRWDEIYSNDRYIPGPTDARIDHVRSLDPRGRGELLGAWAEAKLPLNRGYISVSLHRSQIDLEHRAWSTDWATGDLETLPWYGPRCAVHALAKFFPLTAMTAKVLTDIPNLADVLDDGDEIPSFDGSPRSVVVPVAAEVDAWAEMQRVQSSAQASGVAA